MRKILAGLLIALPLAACTPHTIRIGRPASIQCDPNAVRWAWVEGGPFLTVSSDECTLLRAGFEKDELFDRDPRLGGARDRARELVHGR